MDTLWMVGANDSQWLIQLHIMKILRYAAPMQVAFFPQSTSATRIRVWETQITMGSYVCISSLEFVYMSVD